ncbi:MAG: hypothetical protein P8X77_13145 [Maritimibacter sp.]
MTSTDQPPTGNPTIRTIAMPADTNPAGDIFGGWLMSQMDLAAGSVATFTSGVRSATREVGFSEKVTEANFVFVALDPDGKPIPVKHLPNAP